MLLTLLLAADQPQFVRIPVSFDLLVAVQPSQSQALQQVVVPANSASFSNPSAIQTLYSGPQTARAPGQPVVVQGRFTDALRNGWHYLQDLYHHMSPERRQLLQQGFKQAQHMAIDQLTGQPVQQFINEHGQLIQQIVQNGQIFWKFLQQVQPQTTVVQLAQ